MTPTVIQPDGWAPAKGYANGLLMPDGTLHVAGQIGWGPDQVFHATDFVAQTHQALANIRAIVEAAGGTPACIGRLTWFVKDKRAYQTNQPAIGAAYRSVMGRHFPAMSLIVIKDLLEDLALVEIEATAHIPIAATALPNTDIR